VQGIFYEQSVGFSSAAHYAARMKTTLIKHTFHFHWSRSEMRSQYRVYIIIIIMLV